MDVSAYAPSRLVFRENTAGTNLVYIPYPNIFDRARHIADVRMYL